MLMDVANYHVEMGTRNMPQDSLDDAKLFLREAVALLERRIVALAQSAPHGSLHDRLVVARECIRDAMRKVEHAEQAIVGETAEPCDGRP